MPFDPNIPATNAEATSAMFREQFNGLKDLLDAIPSIGGATVDAVNTVAPGDPAAVSVSFIDGTLHFTFDIPQGTAGEVTQNDLDTAYNDLLANSSANTNDVNTLDNPYADTDAEELRQKMNELLYAMRR